MADVFDINAIIESDAPINNTQTVKDILTNHYGIKKNPDGNFSVTELTLIDFIHKRISNRGMFGQNYITSNNPKLHHIDMPSSIFDNALNELSNNNVEVKSVQIPVSSIVYYIV